ncbi:MAG: shikimate kinase [Bryobacterales bacterium]|nr:shikimate kinase [Bryobacterales bacterium]
MILKLVRTPAVYLIGFMGSGKTTVGRLLADRLGWDFFDLDDDIEQQAGMRISEIFDTQGEEAFRELEREALEARVHRVQGGHAMVLALGGGACMSEHCMARLSSNGVTIHLDCDFETLASRVAEFDHRPLTRDPVRFRSLFNARQPFYALADHRVNGCEGTPEEVADRILRLGVF